MKAIISLSVPDAAELVMQLRMTIGEAKQLREQLVNQYPSWKFGEMLGAAIRRAEAHFTAETNPSD